jgi:hypothetical protein
MTARDDDLSEAVSTAKPADDRTLVPNDLRAELQENLRKAFVANLKDKGTLSNAQREDLLELLTIEKLSSVDILSALNRNREEVKKEINE